MSPLRLLLPALLLGLVPARADEAGCRSVHLWYSDAPVGNTFYNELTVQDSADGTYFAVCGWSRGYFGLQQLGDGRKLVIFSVWDPPSGDDPAGVSEEKRVRLLFRAKSVRIGRFGNEGTGGQSFFDFTWKPGVPYRFAVTARRDGADRTAYTGWFYLPATKQWQRLVTFSTLTKADEALRDTYSFVEDFVRTPESAGQLRRATFGPGWARSIEGEWQSLDQATFTASSHPATNVDAGPAAPGFFLSSGGATPQNAAKLQQTFRRPSATQPPTDLPELR